MASATLITIVRILTRAQVPGRRGRIAAALYLEDYKGLNKLDIELLAGVASLQERYALPAVAGGLQNAPLQDQKR